MKKILVITLTILIIFFGLVYWSLSIGPSEIQISEITSSAVTSEKDLRKLKEIEVRATNQYEANALKRFMQGVNYREAWQVSVSAKIVFLDTFKILEEGGGNQTRSLKIQDHNGYIFSLRSINKAPDPLIPEVAKTLKLENIVHDGISAQHPYGAVLAAALAEKADVLHTHPTIVYVPKQQKLGDFNDSYGNRLYLLEYETENKLNWTSYENVSEIVETDGLQQLKLEMGDGLHVDIPKLVRARLFDLLIGDWDRHSKQWGWVIQQRDDQLAAIPIPGDRDNAFFRIDGVIPTILTNELVQPMVRPFENDIDHVEGYVYPFDLYFLKNVPESVFVQEAKHLQKSLKDERIQQAMAAWPKEISDLNGKEIKEKLIKRRNDLVKYAKKFHKHINEKEALKTPLKGSEDLVLPPNLLRCFECE